MKFKFLLIILISITFYAASCEKQVVSPEVDLPFTHEYFALTLNSNPQGAAVYIDSRNSGYKTPCIIGWLEPKPHTITFKMPLFMDGNVSVDPNNFNIQYDFFSDSRNYGSINCISYPSSAEIILNDKPTGKRTPKLIELLRPGIFKIKYNMSGFRTDSTTVSVSAQNSSEVNLQLVDTTNIVEYSRETGSLFGNKVLTDSKNRIWYGSVYNGLFGFSGNRFIVYNTANSPLPSNMINVIFEDSKGTMWISTSLGVAKLSAAGEWEILNTSNSPLPVNSINGMCEDKAGNIWIATNKALIKYKDGNWDFITTANSGILGNDIITVACGPDNSVWVSCYNLGISKYTNNQWENYTPSNSGMTNKFIYWICVANDNTVYAVGIESGFVKTDSGWEKLSFLNRNTNSFFLGADKTILFSDGATVNMISPGGSKTNRYFGLDKYYQGITFKSITKDKNGIIWLASYKWGLMKIKRL